MFHDEGAQQSARVTRQFEIPLEASKWYIYFVLVQFKDSSFK
jgi:hypothetical protein